MSIPIYQVDAFSAAPFAGNPAAVCLLPAPAPAALDDAWMRNVAREMNLSETAFLAEAADGWGLRWFTPGAEVPLCGHATLATAHVLWETGRLAPDATARFHTLSGLLTAQRRGGWIELDFPALPPEPGETPEALLAHLGVGAPRYVARYAGDRYLIEVGTEEEVRTLAPDFTALAALPERGVIVTSAAASPASGYDFVSRYFAPWVGVNEDPVTGSAHCCLAPYWCGKLGRAELTGFQASARGGRVRVRLEGDRVRLGGQAVTVLRGELAA